MEQITRFRHNVMQIKSLSDFQGIKGGVHRDCKDVCFVRFAGVQAGLASEIRRMDETMAERMRNGGVIYRRTEQLPGMQPADAAEYEARYRDWTAGQKQTVLTNVCKGDAAYAGMLARGLARVSKLFFSDRAFNASIEKNFIVKLLFWHEFLLADALREWNGEQSVKLALSNIVRRQEYFFAYLLTLLGCDVLLLQTEGDISEREERLGLSQKVGVGAFGKLNFTEHARPILRREDVRKRPAAAETKKRTEKTFEQLALLASSVVMIAIHDGRGEVIGTGSGIMIGENGYILTNSHVASGGRYYSIRIEEEDAVYSTDELVKYHSVLDLAVLRIERRLKPLPVYQGSGKLVRGQSVVAIGSPLGLFNSVSDGIISGFRKIDDVDMIQFTAPTSHGSSGGALLNLYGEVIGICTAGFDNAQNINLAVGYESITPFIRGFT